MADLERPKSEGRVHPDHRLRADRAGRGARRSTSVRVSTSRSAAKCRGPTCATSWRSACSTPSHILAPLPLATTLGIDSVNVPMIAAMTLQVNGNALTLSQRAVAGDRGGGARVRRRQRADAPLDARALAAVVAPARAERAKPPVTLASVFPYSSQNYMLRLWLSSGGLDPDRDVRLTVVPPPHTVAHLSGGAIDGYCVGEPWNQQSVVARHRPHRARPAPTSGRACRRRCWARPRPGRNAIPRR